MSGAFAKARACFDLAASTTFDGEREAAISRGLAICDKHGLDPDRFDIPGREKSRPARARYTEFEGSLSEFQEAMASIFGACVGCGGISAVGAMCRACMLKAEAATCSHGSHGFCMECAVDEVIGEVFDA